MIPIVGKIIEDNGTIGGDGSRKFSAFINEDLRGVGLMQNIYKFNDSPLTILIGKDNLDNNASFKFYYFDSLSMNIALLPDDKDHGLFIIRNH